MLSEYAAPVPTATPANAATMAVAIAIRGRLNTTSTISYHYRNDERREDFASSIRRQTFLVKSAGSGTSGCQLRSNFDRSSFMFLFRLFNR